MEEIFKMKFQEILPAGRVLLELPIPHLAGIKQVCAGSYGVY
jgi:hypothetical protein